MEKNQKIKDIVIYLQTKYGANNILIQDHWESSENAIGLIDNSGRYLAYISIREDEDNYYLALEDPPIDNSFPYSPAGEFNNISLMKLENLISKHLRLRN
jgi:predicted component of type VI protein secretion system